LGLAGWVRNLPDGRVEAWVEGAEGPLRDLVAWLAQGPPPARVTAVEVVERASAGFDDFELKR
jgi:acylphosphatase